MGTFEEDFEDEQFSNDSLTLKLKTSQKQISIHEQDGRTNFKS